MLDATDPTNFSARYPSAFRSVAEARHAVADFALDCGFDLADICDIALAVGEACNNAAEHGHNDSGQILLQCRFDGVDLAIVVSDNGRGFDVRGVGHTPGSNGKGDRGLGIFLMRTLMDAVEYDCAGGGTTVRLMKRRRRDG
jgi:anti-sigma regulatory factor (Ser/Thr protein kinase)